MYSEITKLIQPIQNKSMVQFKIGNRNKKIDKGIKSSMYQNLKGIKANKIPIINNINLKKFIS